MATMNVSLPDPMKDWVEAQAGTGRYANASEVVREALRLYEEQEVLGDLIAAADVADAEIARGEAVPFTHELMLQIKQEALDGALPNAQRR